ncbi:MAG: bifunctional metallophosphatase/5'-nucleotidase [Bacilli bacterium]|nr:bifunctional metallophosphatase/5'-nucleotidase [Bacilli bacterium]
MKIKPMKLVSLAALIVTATYFVGCANKTDRNDLVILYTNDVHGFFGEENRLTYSSVAKLKQELIAEGNDVLLVDAGDNLSGSINANYDEGATAVKLMNMTGYDVVTLGNHEFDSGVAHLQDTMKNAKYKYISTNFYHLDNGQATTPFTDTSTIFNFHNHKVGVIGITTPQTIGDCTPDTFQNEQGEFIYTFLKELDQDGKIFFTKVQAEIDQLKTAGCETIIALTHLGQEDDEGQSPLTSVQFVRKTNGIDLVIDAHTHQYMPGSLYPNKDGKLITITQTGSSFSNIGQALITRTNSVYTKMYDYEHYTKHDETVKKAEDDYVNKIEEEFKDPLGKMDVGLVHYVKHDPSEYHEYNLSDFCADGFYYYANNPEGDVQKALKNQWVNMAFINNGGIREQYVSKNTTWTKKTGYGLLPFPNHQVVRKVDGQTLWEALEFSVRSVPNYNSGLLIPAGIRYNLDKSKTAEFIVDKSGNYIEGPTNYSYTDSCARISNIQIYDSTEADGWADFDLKKEYYIAGSDYILKKGGDSLLMFSEPYADKKDRTYEIVYEGDNDYKALNSYVDNFGDAPESTTVNSANSPLKTLAGEYANDCILYEEEEPNKRIILPTA